MDEDETFPALKVLCEIPGPVGQEGPVQDALEEQWQLHGFETRRDRIGNLYGHAGGDGPRVAIVGHADSIGFIVQQVLPEGFVRLAFNTAAATPDTRFLPGAPIRFLAPGRDPVPGVFGLRSGHLAGAEGKKVPLEFDDMFVDLGVDDASAVRDLGIDVGTPAVFGSEVHTIGSNITGPSMDNRVAGTLQCAVARAVARARGTRPSVTLVSTVQEEIGMKGAAAAARDLDIDHAIIIDVGLVGDIPPSKNDHLDTRLGKGPIVLFKDSGIHYDQARIDAFLDIASRRGIPVQRGVFKNYQTDGAHFFMNGIPASVVAVPCRYTHTHFETVRAADLVTTFRLLEAALLP